MTTQPLRNPDELLTEDEVSSAVREHLIEQGWKIESFAVAATGQHGEDIVAMRDGRRLSVEAKGEGSSQSHTIRYGKPFSGGQVKTHVSVAMYQAMKALSKGDCVGIALPDNAPHRQAVGVIGEGVSRLGIAVFWVDRQGAVSVENPAALDV